MFYILIASCILVVINTLKAGSHRLHDKPFVLNYGIFKGNVLIIDGCSRFLNDRKKK